MSGISVIPWIFLWGMTTILTIASSSDTTLTTERMISGEAMMTIGTTASRNETMMTIKTMISNKEMLTIFGSSETILITIIN